MPLCQLFVISICQNMRWLAFILFTWGFSKSPLSRAGGSAGDAVGGRSPARRLCH